MASQKKNTSKMKKSTENTLFPIVGLGASAGGLSAFEAFFSSLPSDTGMAFVLIQHLDPNHQSMLPELIRRYTKMKVSEIEDGMKVEPNCIYISPPTYDILLQEDILYLIDPFAPRGHRHPINYFFSSLAQERNENAIAIVLSGTGNDGTMGIQKVKQMGGLVMAQSPATCEFDSMPANALATGLVDFELSPNEMSIQLNNWQNILHVSKNHKPSPISKIDEQAMQKIMILLRTQTGHDFSLYKPNTIQRRTQRRMAIHNIQTMSEYVKYLQQETDEIDALFNDLLIGVTNFFRDKNAFKVLEEKIIPKIFEDKHPGDLVRIWVAGCSTGEEAYSIAILLMEFMEKLKEIYSVQIFATDIDAQAIATARAGLYPASISADISEPRLRQFFVFNNDKSLYRIHKNIRDMLIFSEHNIIKDPPFSKLDMISCRNLMIYMNTALQEKLIPLFHYSLNPKGILFLGSSESIGTFDYLFSVLDVKSKIYQRKEYINSVRQVNMREVLPKNEPYPAFSQEISTIRTHEKLPLKELTEQTLLKHINPAAALINENGDILYLYGRTGKYLEMPEGETGVNNILKMAREGLKHNLSSALYKAIRQKNTITYPDIHIQTNGNFLTINLTIRSVISNTNANVPLSLYLVIFDEVSHNEYEQTLHHARKKIESLEECSSDDTRIEALKQELNIQKEFLHAANEQLEISNQELKSFNEEIQSMNEELQSSNEELETSKEELQSVNEELSTVNSELQVKVSDLTHANNDMNNLLAGTGIGTIFVDLDLCILRFTPAAKNIINLILSDVGRPVGHIVSNLVGYDSLISDTKKVLDTLIPKELEVQTKKGNWYLMRIQPYRTMENVIEGAVISFVDISELVKIREELKEANKLTRLATVVHDSYDAVTVQNNEGKIIAWNRAAQRMYGWTEDEALQMHFQERVPEALLTKDLAYMEKLKETHSLNPYVTQRLCKDGRIVDVIITFSPLISERNEQYAIATTEKIIQNDTKKTRQRDNGSKN